MSKRLLFVALLVVIATALTANSHRSPRVKRQNWIIDSGDDDAIAFNDGDEDDESKWWLRWPRPTKPPAPQTPRAAITTVSTAKTPTTVEVPGMGTTRTACEDSCLSTQQYNPVCGMDGVTYHNRGRLQCARRCGKDVEMKHFGRCSRYG